MPKIVTDPRARYARTNVVAIRWGVSVATVRDMVDDGTLEGMRVRDMWLVKLSSVEKYEREHKVVPRSKPKWME